MQDILTGYRKAQPKRSTGGLYALAGFDFQLRLYVAQLVDSLVSGDDSLHGAGQVFVEALSDIAQKENDSLVCIQAKRTLNRQALKSAAAEFIAIDDYIQANYPDLRDQIRFELAGSASAADIGWAGLAADDPTGRIQELLNSGRLAPPRVEADPWWRCIAKTWPLLSDPFGFVRYALDRALAVSVNHASADQIRNDICERFRVGRIEKPLPGEALTPAAFAPAPSVSHRLDVGRQITLARVRDQQYMPRPGRVNEITSDIETRFISSRQPDDATVQVHWLSGRSGVGKSALLLQVLERLVNTGHRVLWLNGNAANLEPVLRAVIQQPDELRPEFIAIDDVYDRDARSQLDAARLGSFIDEQGATTWPLLLTCGPDDFREDFERDTQYRGFTVHRKLVHPVAANEAEQLATWYRDRMGRDPKRMVAFEEARTEGGLFVSMAVELEFGDLREFATRFAKRIRGRGLGVALSLPLALNRLYLRSPYDWLDDNARERLASLNVEGDFAIFEAGERGQYVRLTHPHLSDALYRELPEPPERPSPTSFAHDLARAFQKALEEKDANLVVRLLRVFSNRREGILAERLASVDDTILAERCARHWKSSPIEVHHANLSADLNASWACWAASQPAIARELGDNLLPQAIHALDNADRNWPACWNRLWQGYPGEDGLIAWAKHHLPTPGRMEHPQWSFVWEAVYKAIGEATESRASWSNLALTWLRRPDRAADWHLVWKQLVPQDLDSETFAANPAIVVGRSRLDQSPDGPEWAYVVQDLLGIAAHFAASANAVELAALAHAWLQGREDRAEWNYVWQNLLERPNELAGAGIPLPALLLAGHAWLQGREDRAEWNYVWQTLLERPNELAEVGVPLPALLATGLAWLQGREDRAEWTYVWQTLLERPNELAGAGIPLPALLLAGHAWLQGREDRAEWTHVWETLLKEANALAEAGIPRTSLLDFGLKWLPGREDRADWAFIWQALLRNAVDTDALVPLGVTWLDTQEHLAHKSASHIIEVLLENRCTDPRFLKRAKAWLDSDSDPAPWPLVAAKYISVAADTPESEEVASALMGKIDLMPNRGNWIKVERILLASPHRAEPGSAVEMLLEALRNRAEHPAWIRAREAMSSGTTLSARVTKHLSGNLYSVELAIGLAAQLSTTKQGRFRADDQLDVIVNKLNPEKGYVRVFAAGDFADGLEVLNDAPLLVGEEYDGTVTGLPEFGIFVRVGASVGLVRNIALPPREVYERAYPMGSTIRVRVVQISAKGPVLVLASGGHGSGEDSSNVPVVVGQEFDGIVTGLSPVGVFVQIGAHMGLIYRNTLPQGEDHEQTHPVGSTIRVRVIEITTRGLVLRIDSADLQGRSENPNDVPVVAGQEYDGIVTGLQDYGIFVRVGFCSGLIHSNTLPQGVRCASAQPIGSTIRVRVIEITPRGLVLVLASGDQQRSPELLNDAPVVVGQEYDGIVTGLASFGIFVHIGANKGLIHRDTLPPEEIHELAPPLGSTIRVRVVEITPRGLALHRVAQEVTP